MRRISTAKTVVPKNVYLYIQYILKRKSSKIYSSNQKKTFSIRRPPLPATIWNRNIACPLVGWNINVRMLHTFMLSLRSGRHLMDRCRLNLTTNYLVFCSVKISHHLLTIFRNFSYFMMNKVLL